jgi:hypothetical protein
MCVVVLDVYGSPVGKHIEVGWCVHAGPSVKIHASLTRTRELFVSVDGGAKSRWISIYNPARATGVTDQTF